MTRRRGLLLLALPLLLLGGWQAAVGLYIPAKAIVAQHLLQAAWDRSRDGTSRRRPWPWADTWPVARLAVPRLGVDQIVLAGATGRTLAFAPGEMAGAGSAAGGTTIIAGHRDTHFRFLDELRTGDSLRVERPDGTTRMYRVAETKVVDRRRAGLRLDHGAQRLALVTCYPFDAIRPGGPLRYVVVADRI